MSFVLHFRVDLSGYIQAIRRKGTQNMRVLFIYPSDNRTFNAGIGSLSAVLKSAGHQTSLFMSSWNDAVGLRRSIEEFDPDLVAVSSVTNQFPRARGFIEQAHAMSGKPVIIGGVHATLLPEEVIKTPGLTALSIGEAEESLLEFVDAMERDVSTENIPGIWVKRNGKIHRNPSRPPVEDLNSLPFPDYALFQYDEILDQMNGQLMVFANRGCPYTCSYCINHSLLELYRGHRYVRFLSADRLMAQLHWLLKAYPRTNIIEFFDDTFILNQQWVSAFLKRYSQEIGKPYYCNVRADLIDDQIVDLLKESGCARVNVAIESGNEQLRRAVLDKNVSDEQLYEAFRLFKRAGVRTYAHNMVGIPFETEATIRQTIAMNKDLGVDDLQCWVFYPYPGSSAYNLVSEQGWLAQRHFDTIAGKIVTSTLDQPTISHERVSYYHRIFKFMVFGEQTPAEDIPLDRMLIGQSESQMISGWNNLELDKGIPFRWTTNDGRFYLRNTAKRYLCLHVNYPAPTPPPLIEISVNGVSMSQFIPQKGLWQWIEVVLPEFEEPVLEVSLQVDNPYLPALHDPHDLRVLGVAVSKMVLETAWERFVRKYRQWRAK